MIQPDKNSSWNIGKNHKQTLHITHEDQDWIGSYETKYCADIGMDDKYVY